MTQENQGEVDAASPADRMRAAIPRGVALIVGVLTAIGIDGEVRERLIRNAPYSIFFALALEY